MTELASINLFQTLGRAGGSDPAWLGDYSDIAWRGRYRRVSMAMGGEHEAIFRITQQDLDLREIERLFGDALGYHMVESYAGKERHFYLNTLRLSIGATVMSWSLDDMWNHVRVLYQQDSSSTAVLTTAATDQDSIDRWGQKEIIIRPHGYMNQGQAEEKRDQYLTDHKHPLTSTSNTRGRKQPTAILEARFKGYVHSIAWDYYQSTSKTATDRDDLILTIGQNSDYISATTDTIETDTTQVISESDYTDRLTFLDDLVDQTGYRYYVTAGRQLFYETANVSEIFYTRREGDPLDVLYRHGQPVPAPLVEPGRVVWTEDLFGDRSQASPLLSDPRARWLTRVTYDANGVRQTGGPEPRDETLTADLALMAFRNAAKKGGLTHAQ